MVLTFHCVSSLSALIQVDSPVAVRKKVILNGHILPVLTAAPANVLFGQLSTGADALNSSNGSRSLGVLKDYFWELLSVRELNRHPRRPWVPSSIEGMGLNNKRAQLPMHSELTKAIEMLKR
jgi:hypothetical protein